MRKKRHILRRLLMLILVAAAVGIAYMYLSPLMITQQTPVYAEYTVRRGSIATEKSFSASISVASSETHQNTTRATAIREIYVENGQSVKAGDKLMLLDNGEVLKAGLDGVVTEMRFDTTDWLWNNVQLIQISDLTHLKVSLSVDEYDVRNVSAGQGCTVTIVPLGAEFETVISHVDRVSSSSGQVAYYTASADITVPSNVLPGMTASVTIPSDKAEDVLLVDMAALAFDDEGQPYVLQRAREGDEYVRVPVTTGLSNGMQVEILSGLNEGEAVWAVAGMEETASALTLTEIYKKLVGEKIVINDMTGGSNRTSPTRTNFQPGQPGMPFFEGVPAEEGAGGWPAAPHQPGEESPERMREEIESGVKPSPASTVEPAAQPQQETETDRSDVDSEGYQTQPPARREQERKDTP